MFCFILLLLRLFRYCLFFHISVVSCSRPLVCRSSSVSFLVLRLFVHVSLRYYVSLFAAVNPLPSPLPAFDLTFGALFSKAYRVRTVLLNAMSGRKKARRSLLSVVAGESPNPPPLFSACDFREAPHVRGHMLLLVLVLLVGKERCYHVRQQDEIKNTHTKRKAWPPLRRALLRYDCVRLRLGISGKTSQQNKNLTHTYMYAM